MAKPIFTCVADPDAAMRNFNDGLRKVLSVSKEQMNRAMARVKASREGKPKRGPKPAAEHSR